VWADAFEEPDDPKAFDRPDPAVFASVFARQDLDGTRWLIRGVLRTSAAGAPILARVTIEPLDDLELEVTGRVIRDVSFATIRDAALVHLRRRARAAPYVSDRRVRELERAAKVAAMTRGRRGAYTTEHYHEVARTLVRLQRNQRKNTLDELRKFYAEQLGEDVKGERVRGWVKEATRLGFLAPGRKGVAHREPGPNYKEDTDA
jgi:hypothetical protein